MSKVSRWLKRRIGIPEAHIVVRVKAADYEATRAAFEHKASSLGVPGMTAGILFVWLMSRIGVEVKP